eukprot:GEMP01007672.1.p1 GENE.GEMP01007672.1~~GEMP01007672.1.p1  ORF type:complete len:708 (+),score=169.23 GEMP01007672.1:465-2588(+)
MDTRASKLSELKRLVDEYSWNTRLDNLDQELSAFDHILDQQIAHSSDSRDPDYSSRLHSGLLGVQSQSIKPRSPSQALSAYSSTSQAQGHSKVPAGSRSVSYALPMLPPATASTGVAERASSIPPVPLGLPPAPDRTSKGASSYVASSHAASWSQAVDKQDVATQAHISQETLELPPATFTPGNPSMEAPCFPLPNLRTAGPWSPPPLVPFTPLTPPTTLRREWTRNLPQSVPPPTAGGPGGCQRVASTPVTCITSTNTPHAAPPPPHYMPAHTPPPPAHTPPNYVPPPAHTPPNYVPPPHAMLPPTRVQMHPCTTAPQSYATGVHTHAVQYAPSVHLVPSKRGDTLSSTPIVRSRSPCTEHNANHVYCPSAYFYASGHHADVGSGLSCPPRGGTNNARAASPVHGSENHPPNVPALGRHLSHPALHVFYEEAKYGHNITNEPAHPIERLGPYCPPRGRKLNVARHAVPDVPVLGHREALTHHRARSRSLSQAPPSVENVEDILRPPARAAGTQNFTDGMADASFQLPQLNLGPPRARLRTPSASPGLTASPISLHSARRMVSPRCCYTINARLLPPARGYVRDPDAATKMPTLITPPRFPVVPANFGCIEGVGTTPAAIGVNVYDIAGISSAGVSAGRAGNDKLFVGPQPQMPVMSHSEEYAVKGRPWHVLPPRRILNEAMLDTGVLRSLPGVLDNLGMPFRPQAL